MTCKTCVISPHPGATVRVKGVDVTVIACFEHWRDLAYALHKANQPKKKGRKK